MPGDAARSPVGLLLVHGIGKQARGQSLDGLLSGLQRTCGDGLEIRRLAADHAVLDGIGRSVHVFEVFWADLLHGESVRGTFDFDRVFELVWFPLLNDRHGWLRRDVWSHAMVLRWTWVLAPLSALLSVGLVGARLMATIPTVLKRSAARSRERRTAPAPGGSWWGRVKANYKASQAPEAKRTILDDLLDEVAGDVFNYVHGVADAFPAESERNRALRDQVSQIHPRFVDAAQRAVAQGCEEIQVLAHSLGTVVAFRGMCPELVPVASGTPARLTHFYTIGSPLQKFRFFWTRLVEYPHEGPAIVTEDRLVADGRTTVDAPPLRWDNFHSRFDIVSGRLTPVSGWPAPVNHSVAGLGGLIRSHTSYTGNPILLEMLLVGLTGMAVRIHLPWTRRLRRTVVSTLENLALPAALLTLAWIGLGMMAGMGWVVGGLVATPLEWLNLGALARGVQWYFVLSILFVLTIVSVGLGRARARELHARFWARKGPSAMSPEAP